MTEALKDHSELSVVSFETDGRPTFNYAQSRFTILSLSQNRKTESISHPQARGLKAQRYPERAATSARTTAERGTDSITGYNELDVKPGALRSRYKQVFRVWKGIARLTHC